MKNWKEISNSDEREIIDDPNPIASAESTRLDESLTEKDFNNSRQKNKKGSEGVSKDKSNNLLKSGRNSVEKLIQKTSNSSTNGAKKKSLGNDTASVQATFNIKELSSDDEVYMFHCPENIKKHNFLNKIINISKSNQFVYANDGEKYQLDIFNLENQQITLAVPEKSVSGKLFNLPLKGHIVVQKVFEQENHTITDLCESEDKIIFPKDIKIRHPFLGVNWKCYIDSAKEAIEKHKKIKRKIKKEKSDELKDLEERKVKRKDSAEISSPIKRKKKS